MFNAGTKHYQDLWVNIHIVQQNLYLQASFWMDGLYRHDLTGLPWCLSSLKQQNPLKNVIDSDRLVHTISLALIVQKLQLQKRYAVFQVKKHGDSLPHISSNSMWMKKVIKTKLLFFPKIISLSCLGVLWSIKCVFILRMPKFIESRHASTLVRGRWGWQDHMREFLYIYVLEPSVPFVCRGKWNLKAQQRQKKKKKSTILKQYSVPKIQEKKNCWMPN